MFHTFAGCFSQPPRWCLGHPVMFYASAWWFMYVTLKIDSYHSLKQNFQLNQRLLQMMRYIKMFLTHVQTPLHCSNCQKSPISMFFWWFSERDEKQLRCLFQPQMLHSDAQCFFQPLKRKSPPPLRRQNKAPFDSCMVCSQRAFFSSGIHVIGSKMAEGPAIFFSFEIQFEVVVKYAVSWYRCMGIFPTGQLPIGHTCHRA